jgi:RNA polymerase sigma factor (sigma-70 family)
MQAHPLSSLTDHELIGEFKSSQNREVLGVLFTRYTSLVFGTCLKYLKDREDAKDAVMQIFEKLNETLLKYDVQNFKSWLYVSARNHCLMQLRAKKGKETKILDSNLMESDYVLHLEIEPEMEETISKLEKCIEELGEEQRACVRLFYIQEKCYRDIAVETGFELRSVKSFIQNGKRNLRLCMEKNG